MERKNNKEKISIEYYEKEIKELFDSTFYVLNREIQKFEINDEDFNSYRLSLYLNLLYELIKNNEAICPDLNVQPIENFMTPISCLNEILTRFNHIEPISYSLKILTEIIYNHFQYFDFDAINQIQSFLDSAPGQIQSLAINFFYTLFQIVSNKSNSINLEQIESLRGLINELDLFSTFCQLLKSNCLYFKSNDYTIQSLDILIDFLPNNDLLQNFDLEMIEHLCLLVDVNLKTETLDSILNIFSELLKYLTATDLEQRNDFIQIIIENIEQDTIEEVLESVQKKLSLNQKAQHFFDQINELASSNTED